MSVWVWPTIQTNIEGSAIRCDFDVVVLCSLYWSKIRIGRTSGVKNIEMLPKKIFAIKRSIQV